MRLWSRSAGCFEAGGMNDIKSEFNCRIDAGYKEYRRELKDMGNAELIEKVKDIAAMQNLY